VRANTQSEKFSYYPYGEERTVTPDGREKFGTYFRDSVGQDYADQRYYNSGAVKASPGRTWSARWILRCNSKPDRPPTLWIAMETAPVVSAVSASANDNHTHTTVSGGKPESLLP